MRPFDRESITTSFMGYVDNSKPENLQKILSDQQGTQSTLRQFIRNFQTDDHKYCVENNYYKITSEVYIFSFNFQKKKKKKKQKNQKFRKNPKIHFFLKFFQFFFG